MTTADFIVELCWLAKRVGVSALFVGMFWNGDAPAERVGVYMVTLGVVLLVGWVRSVRKLASA